MKHTTISVFFLTGSLLLLSSAGYTFDSANDSTVDKADRFEFEEFHKDSAVTLWGKDKDKKEDAKAITTYEEPKPDAQSTSTSVKEGTVTTASTKSPINTFDKGQELKVRSAYKLSVDPSLAAIPTLFEAIQNLYQQLNSYCPKGWTKEEEWDLPEANYFYIHYRAKCL